MWECGLYGLWWWAGSKASVSEVGGSFKTPGDLRGWADAVLAMTGRRSDAYAFPHDASLLAGQ